MLNCLEYYELTELSNKYEIELDKFINIINKENRKLFMVYGNCQISSIVSLFLTCEDFVENYLLIQVPPIQDFKEEEKIMGIRPAILKSLDVFCYQHVRQDNKFSYKLSTDYMTQHLKNSCKRICIPNIYFEGYWPQHIKNKFNPPSKKYKNGLFPYGDKYIMEMWDKYSVDQIYTRISTRDFIPSEEILQNYKDTIQELKIREQICDVTISDFIEKNYKENLLFYVPNHPKNIVLSELCHRIAEKIGDLNLQLLDMDIEKAYDNNGRELPIYPCVKEVLELKFDQNEWFYLRQAQKQACSFKDWVKTYYDVCKAYYLSTKKKVVCKNYKWVIALSIIGYDENKYIYRKTKNEKEFRCIAALKEKENSYEDSDIREGEKYWYKIKAGYDEMNCEIVRLSAPKFQLCYKEGMIECRIKPSVIKVDGYIIMRSEYKTAKECVGGVSHNNGFAIKRKLY